MRICLIEPFFSGSHKQWAESLKQHSSHSFEFLTLPGKHWKWRMHGGAVSLAKKFNELDDRPDLILASDMLDVTTFLSLTRIKSSHIPVAVYFHENQLTYPWSPIDRDVKHKRDNHYSFINYTTALTADKVLFNSEYHKRSFLDALPNFLKQFPDKQGMENIEHIRDKSEVLHLGLDLSRFDETKPQSIESKHPILLWNHRWEYDKNPNEFFEVVFELDRRQLPFELVVLGEQNEMKPPVFAEAKERLNHRILHWGYCETFEEYAQWLWKADVLPVTSNQDFFGGSVVEAMYCECMPLLPNRLAYPDHIPSECKSSFIYSEKEALIEQLTSLLQNPGSLQRNSPRDFVKHYDWNACIEKYDEIFEGMQ